VLKSNPVAWTDVVRGGKHFEIRVNDRGYARGDELLLCLWTAESGFIGPAVHVHVAEEPLQGRYGLPPDVCILQLYGASNQARDVFFADADHRVRWAT